MKTMPESDFLAGIVLAGCFALSVTSCSFDETLGLEDDCCPDNTKSIVANDSWVHPLIQGHYVEFVNNQYVVTISREDALKQGISEASYDEFSKTLEDGNRLLASVIDSCINEGFTVNVSTNLYANNGCGISSYPRVKRFGELSGFPSGTITTIGQEYGKQGIRLIPSAMTAVDCDCYSYAAPCPMQIVIAESWGTMDVQSGIGVHIRLNAGFSVTNIPGNVQYATTGSSGGTCSWRGISQ